jgi:CelD/BcsL family acetyltransferase involved in cellulose biosynthesis
MVTRSIDDPRWLEFVRSCPDATPFHHPAWASLVADAYRLRAFALTSGDPGGRVTAGLPMIETSTRFARRWVALPFTDHCPPLVGAAETAHRFAADVDEARRSSGVSRVEVRADLGGAGTRRAGAFVLHMMRLPAHRDEILRRVEHKSTRRNVRKAQREGVTVRWGDAAPDLHDRFYGLHLATRHRLGVPVQPRRFFRLLWERIVERDLGFVLLAEVGNRPIAGAVFLAWNGRVVYKYGASDRAAWSLRPNDLLFFAALTWAVDNGYRSFDFGRSDADAVGLRRFKSGWGGTETPLTYSVLPTPSARRFAVGLGSVAGPAIRRSPRWVLKVAGELFYRYAA